MHARNTIYQPLVFLIPCLLILSLCIPTPVFAAPAAPLPVELVQPDGTIVNAVAWGDEWNHGFETTEGYTIELDEASGFWVYFIPADTSMIPELAGLAQSGAGRLIAGKDDPSGLPRHLRPTGSERASDALPENSSFAGDAAPALATRPQTMVGTQKVLVLLVDFNNRAGTYTAASFATKFFGTSYSVKSFYQTASYNKLTLAPAAESSGTANDGVIGWLRLNYNHPNNSKLSPTTVRDALTAANQYVNYASFDTNKDGYISNTELHIMVVAAGYEESFGDPPSPMMWAHRWVLDAYGFNYDLVLDGVHLGQSSHDGGYAIIGEIHTTLYNGTPYMPHQATIGVMIHELGHDLNMPDLYDTSQTSEGVGNWSIMGGGSWNTTHASTYLYGDSPALPDAFLRYYQGWLTPTSAVSNTTYTLADSSTNVQALMMGYNPNGVDWDFDYNSGTGEYWLVENRNRTSFDAGLPGCGVLVWHIDESVIYNNTANANRNRPLVELVQADGNRDLYYSTNGGDAGDPFPGTGAKLAFTPATTPAFKYYSGANGMTLHLNTTACASSMSVTFNKGVILNKKVFLPLTVR